MPAAAAAAMAASGAAPAWPHHCLLPIGANSATFSRVLSRVGAADPKDAAGALDRFWPTRTMTDREQTRLHM